MASKIPLFWYSLYKFNKHPHPLSKQYIRKMMGMEKENYGDLLSKYIVEKIYQKKSKWYKPKPGSIESNLFAVGSILNFTDKKSIVWGSGIINKKHNITNCDFRAVRGPHTRKRLLELGFHCPEIYGDPALLLPLFFNPEVKKEYEIGIIPHFYDHKVVKELYNKNRKIKIINLITENIEKTTEEILQCKRVVSSSLHGLIVAHAYRIPAVWVRFSNNLNGDNVKFDDYLESVGMPLYKGLLCQNKNEMELFYSLFQNYENLPHFKVLKNLQKGLVESYPLDFCVKDIPFRIKE